MDEHEQHSRKLSRRAALIGAGGAAALVATATSATTAAALPGPIGTTTSWAPVATQAITFAGPTATLQAAWAPAARPRGGVLVVHDNRGLRDHFREIAGRLAAGGYSALALDLLSQEGGTGSFPDEATVAAALSAVAGSNPQRFDADLRAAVGELARRLPFRRLGAIGFALGGGLVWRLLAAGEKRLAAAVPFYGPFPTGASLRSARGAVLGVYAGLDDRVNESREAARAALAAARLRHEILTFTAAEHAFFDHTGTRFDPPAAAESYRRVFGWFGEHIG